MVRFATVLFSTAAIFCLALLFGCAGSPPVEQQAVNCSNYSISDCPSQCVDCLACPNCTGACHTPEFCQNALLNQSLPQNVVPVNNTPGNNTPQNNTPVFAPLPENATVEWEGAATEYLNGPEGSFPEGCAVEQEVDLEIRTGGTELEPDQFDGYVTTKLTKIINCSAIMPDSLIGTGASAPIFGAINGSTVTFTSEDAAHLGFADYSANISMYDVDGTPGYDMNGTLETCHSPDERCTCDEPDPRCPGGVDSDGNPVPGHIDTVNWWTGDFIAEKIG